MIVLSILAIAVIVLILIQTPEGNSKVLIAQTGAKNNHSTLTKVTWALAVGMIVLTLTLY